AARDERLADLVPRQVHRACRRQQLAAAEMVVKEEAEPQHPGRTQAGMVGQNETQGADNVRRDLPEDLALDQRLAHQPKLVIFEIAQATMHQLGRPGRRPARQVIHFTKENRVTPARRIARDAAAVDAASDDGEIENPVQRTFPGSDRLFVSAILLSDWSKSQPKTKASENGEPAGKSTSIGLDAAMSRLRGSRRAASPRSSP